MSVAAGGHVPTLVALRKFEFANLALPAPQDDEVLVKLRATGVCGTDLHLYESDWGFMPVVLGHDAVGEIVGTGERVVIDPAMSCAKCEVCIAGRRSACAEYKFLGLTAPGTFAQYLTIPKRNVIPIPDSLSDVAGTVLEPICVALHLRDRLQNVVSTSSPVLLVGGGPIGIVAARILMLEGYEVSVVESVESRRERVRSWGITCIASHEMPAVQNKLGARLVAVETSSSIDGAELAMKWAGIGGVVAVIGAPALHIRLGDIVLKDQTIIGIRGGAGRYPEAVALAASGSIPVEELISHRRPITDLESVIVETNQNPREIYRTVLIH